MDGADHTIPHTAAIFVTMLHTPHQVNILIIMPAITVTVKRKSHDT